MDDTEHDGNGEEFEEQFEQMLIENGVLVHALAALLVRKGILKQEEIDSEMDRLYDEMENFEQERGIAVRQTCFEALKRERDDQENSDCHRARDCRSFRSERLRAFGSLRAVRQRPRAVHHDQG